MKYEKEVNELKEWYLNEKKADEKDFNDFFAFSRKRKSYYFVSFLKEIVRPFFIVT